MMREWGLQRLPYSGRLGWAETERMPTSSPQLCHVAARQASREQVSAALLAPAAMKLTRCQDSSVMFSLTRERLLLRKEVLLSFPLPATATALLLLSNGTPQGFEPSGVIWSPAKRYNREERSREPFSSRCQETASLPHRGSRLPGGWLGQRGWG